MNSSKINKDIQKKIAHACVSFFIVLLIPLLTIGITASIFPYFQPTRFWSALLNCFTLVVIPYLLLRKGKALRALQVIILGMHFLILTGTILNNGIDAPIYVGFATTLVLIGWISSSARTIAYTICFTAYGLLLVILDQKGILPERDRPTEMARYIYYSSYMVIIAITTILANKQLHKTLLERESKQRLLTTSFETIPDALLVLSGQGRIIEKNKQAGRLLHQISDKGGAAELEDIVLESHDTSKNTLLNILRENDFDFNKMRFRLTDSPLNAWFSISATPMIQEDGSPGAILVISDISTEVQQEYNLVQAQKMDAVGQLVSGIAHDFNNMLGGIQGATDLLQEDAMPQQKKMLNLIQNATDKASKLTKELLVFSRKAPHASSAVDLHSIITETAFILGRTLDKKINVTKELGAESSFVIGDDTLIQSALMNIGINASHAMPAGGSLTFSTSLTELDEQFCSHSGFNIDPGNYLAIAIKDTGCGMSEEVQKHIFEPFFTTKEVGKGTGLGMTAVYNMVRKHRGMINVYSELDRGSSFHIFLPLAHQNENIIQESQELVVNGSGKVLIVDDEEVIRITAAEMLRNLGYTIYTAENGHEALEFLQKTRVDVILLDMIMPVMNGRETFERLMERGIDSRVILSSGFSKEEDVRAMKAMGLFGFLHKPYQRHLVSQMIARAVNRDQSETPPL